VIAVSPIGLASVVADMPQIETSKASTLHMEDTAPLPISQSGVVAAPTRSLWQTDCVATKISYGARCIGPAAILHHNLRFSVLPSRIPYNRLRTGSVAKHRSAQQN
jgi:hypothetical protein